MEGRYKKFYLEWWNIRQSTIIVVVGLVLFGVIVAGGSWFASRNNWFAPQDLQDAPKDSARIISFEGEVRITRAATRETILVTRETYVAAGDTVQTQADGRAIIQMIDGSVYSVRPNSTVVVRDTTSLFGGKNVRVRLNDGQLLVRTDDQPDNVRNIVELAETENRLGPKTDASFNTEGGTGGEIRVSRGGVETTLGGETSKINANEFAAVRGESLAAREKLLAPPNAVAPANSAQIVDNGGGVNVGFAWQDPEPSIGQSYYIQVARSPYFSSDSILVDRGSLLAREFKLAGVSPGTYYWRIRSTSKTGQTTNWSEAARFTIVKRENSIQIEASDWKVENIGGSVHIISGRTMAGMAVRSQGREAFAGADGSFKLQISSPSTEASVEISDDRGNRSGFVISLRSSKVLRRY